MANFTERERRFLESVRQDPNLPQASRDRAAALLGRPALPTPQGLIARPEPAPPPPGAVGRPLPIPSPAQAEVGGAMAGQFLPGGKLPYLSAIPVGLAGGTAALATDLLRGELRSPEETAMSFVRPAVGELAAPPLFKGIERGARAIGAAGRLAGEPVARGIKRLGERFDVPLTAADITGRKPAAMLENFANFFWLGSGFIQRFRQAQVEQMGEAVQRAAAKQYQGLADKVTTGLLAQGGIRTAVKEFRRQSEEALAQIDLVAGDELVNIAGLKATARKILDEASRRPLGAPTGARKLAELGEIPPGPAQEQLLVGDLMERIEDVARSEVDEIPFRDVRQIRSQLGELAFRGKTAAIGRIRQGQLGAMYNAVDQDMETFLGSEAGAAVAPLERDFRKAYAAGKILFNESVVASLKRLKPGQVQRLSDMVFRADAPQSIVDFRQAVSEPIYNRTLAAWFQGVLRKSTPLREREALFSPAEFVRQLEPFVKEGTLDVMFEPALAREIEQLVQLSSVLKTAERIAGNPSGTGQAFLASRQIFDAAKLIPLALTGQFAAGGPGALAAVALPAAIGFGVTSGPGRALLTEGLRAGPIKRQAGRLATQVGSQLALPRETQP